MVKPLREQLAESPVERSAPAKRGRPPGPSKQKVVDLDETEAGFEPAPMRSAPRQPARDSVRDTVVHTPRRGAMVVTGRNGEVLTRRRTQTGDQYHVPPNEIPDGWSYQWNPVSILNEETTKMQIENYENGWRPVPANRHAGRWTKPGTVGEIVIEGLRLEERPQELTNEALREEERKAKQQLRDQTDALRLSRKLPEGFDVGRQYKGTGADVRMSIDKNLDLAPSGYQPADDEL